MTSWIENLMFVCLMLLVMGAFVLAIPALVVLGLAMCLVRRLDRRRQGQWRLRA